MNDWEKLAEAVTPRLPASELAKVVPVLLALEKTLRAHESGIPHSAAPWTNAEDVE